MVVGHVQYYHNRLFLVNIILRFNLTIHDRLGYLADTVAKDYIFAIVTCATGDGVTLRVHSMLYGTPRTTLDYLFCVDSVANILQVAHWHTLFLREDDIVCPGGRPRRLYISSHRADSAAVFAMFFGLYNFI
jgi:hypothetical protein